MTFTPTEFSTIEDKEKFAKQFKRLIETDFKRTMFRGPLYKRLSMTFGNIAHYDINGFYGAWFLNSKTKLAFIRNCLRYGCYGSPAYTFSDVEQRLQGWLIDNGWEAHYERLVNEETEATERETLAHLQSKYG